MTRSLAVSMCLCLFLSACTFQRLRKEPTKLQVIAVPKTATVKSGHTFLGTAQLLAKKPKELAPGTHFITIEAPGYFPHDVEVKLVPGTTKIEIKLRPVPE